MFDEITDLKGEAARLRNTNKRLQGNFMKTKRSILGITNKTYDEFVLKYKRNHTGTTWRKRKVGRV